MFTFQFCQAFAGSPELVGRSKDRLVGQRAGAAFLQRCQCLVETVVIKECKNDQGTASFIPASTPSGW